MGAVNTTYTFTDTDTITSTKMNNIIDQTTMTSDAIIGSTLQVTTSGKLAVNAQGITSNELAANAVITTTVLDNAITNAKIATKDSFVPAGAVMAFAGGNPPSGWLYCDGQAVSRTIYAALFAVTSTSYGAGDGSTTFNVPDLRGAFIRGHDNGRGLDPSRGFGTYQADAFASHTHTVAAGEASGTSSGCGVGSTFQKAGNANCGTVTTSSTGSTETRPKNYALHYFIKI